MQTFSKAEAFNFGWEKTKANLGFLLGLQLLWWFLYLVPFSVAQYFLAQGNEFLGAILFILDMGLTLLICIGIIKIGLNIVDGSAVGYSDLFSGWGLILKFLGASLLYVLLVFIGLMFFIIPGIIIMTRLVFFPHFIVDKQMGVIEALLASVTITGGAGWNIFLFYLISSIISTLGVLLLLVGTFATTPVLLIAYAYIYRCLLNNAEATGLLAT